MGGSFDALAMPWWCGAGGMVPIPGVCCVRGGGAGLPLCSLWALLCCSQQCMFGEELWLS